MEHSPTLLKSIQRNNSLQALQSHLENQELFKSQQQRVNHHLLEFLAAELKICPSKSLAVLGYHSFFPGEFDLRPTCENLSLKLNYFLPKITRPNSLEFYRSTAKSVIGKFNIPEPQGTEKINLQDYSRIILLIPGLSFDLAGNRLGRGLGFYDRFIAQLPTKGLVKIGTCLNLQIQLSIPTENHDQRMDCLLTETGLIRINNLT